MAYEDEIKDLIDVKRLWMLIPRSREAYVPGFEGSFAEALVEAAGHAAFWKTEVTVYEANPEHYRREGGLKKPWIVVRIPNGSSLKGKD